MRVCFFDPGRTVSKAEIKVLLLFDIRDNILISKMPKAAKATVFKMEKDSLLISYVDRYGKKKGFLRSIYGGELLNKSLDKGA